MAGTFRLCALAELPESGSARFDLPSDTPGQPRSNGLCVIRQGEQVRGYLNRCPHTGGPMDWVEGRFLSEDGKLIQCSNHGALFRIEDGYCIYGPCAGASLTAVRLVRCGNDIYLENGK